MNAEEPNLYEAMISDEKSYGYGWKAGKWAERERIINDLKDQFAFVMECETQENLEQAANSVVWSERWQLTFNQLIALIKGETK